MKIIAICFYFICCPDSLLPPHLFLHPKDELGGVNRRGSKPNSPSSQGSVSRSGAPAASQGGGSSQDGTSKSNTPTSRHTPLSPRDIASTSMSPASSQAGGSASATPLITAASDVATESVNTPSDGLNKNLDWSTGKPDGNKNIAEVQDGQQGQRGHDSQEAAVTSLDGEGQYCNTLSIMLRPHCNQIILYQGFAFFPPFETNLLICVGCTRWSRQPGEVWGAGYHRVHPWTRHGSWWLQRNKVNDRWLDLKLLLKDRGRQVFLNKSHKDLMHSPPTTFLCWLLY